MHFLHRPYVTGETIAALATPPGEGGIAIIRISGNQSLEIADTIFSGPVFSYSSHTVHLGKVLSHEGKILDEVLLLVMKAPRSFTGEDTVEIHCHGGSLAAKKILERILQVGARIAGPGEFSFKAFMNGKMDLSQAEAIQQVISAKNERAFFAAEQHLQGALSQKISAFQKQLIDIAAILEAWVDFPEEGLEFASEEELTESMQNILHEMEKLSDSFYEGKILQEGLALCLVGPPNAGKSSLMNALLGKDRAIVTEIAGTTRDLLEDQLFLGDLHLRLVDTAGIRQTEECIEKEGIRRSKQAMQEADLILLVLDGSRDQDIETLDLLENVPEHKTLLVWNKKDLPSFQKRPSSLPSVALSAHTKEGLEDLKKSIHQCIWKKGPPSQEEVVLSSLRHKQALDQAIDYLSKVLHGLYQKTSPEFLCFDLRKCLFELGTILGMHISEEILSAVFSKFCVGK
ncbi:MAG: tRNA uridine-5-carboxymethylaminomethyl(34) synthesis GTPase MnmE [Chlamydiae bacterium]|nr:tRNA uridine-5-carboxymethylaminomethyl(34) synthesis GTPase MnmE [Chlamydiota bacterium]